MKPLTVAILGAAGTIAPAIVRDLAQSDEVDRLVLIDLDEARARLVAERHGQGRAVAREGDARGDLASALADVDLLVNAASYRVNLEAMRASLEARCHYLDLGGLYWLTRRQLELDADFRRAGRLALLGIGSSPGKTNLMAAHAVALLGSAEKIAVSAAGRDPAANGRLRPPYALQTLIDELTMAPVVLREGKPVELAPLSPGGRVDFGDPIGQSPTIHTLHSELATFGQSFGCREASFRLSLPAALLSRLTELAGASPDELARASRDFDPPSDQTVSVHVIDASAGSRGVRVRAVTRPFAAFGVGGSLISTAAPAAAAVRLIARGAISAIGALPPEDCIEPEALFAELATRGCEVIVERSEDRP